MKTAGGGLRSVFILKTTPANACWDSAIRLKFLSRRSCGGSSLIARSGWLNSIPGDLPLMRPRTICSCLYGNNHGERGEIAAPLSPPPPQRRLEFSRAFQRAVCGAIHYHVASATVEYSCALTRPSVVGRNRRCRERI